MKFKGKWTKNLMWKSSCDNGLPRAIFFCVRFHAESKRIHYGHDAVCVCLCLCVFVFFVGISGISMDMLL